MKLTWYDGGLMPPDPEELENETLDPNGGVLYVGKKAKLLHYSEGARLLPTSKHNSYGAPKERAHARAARRPRDELGPRDQGHAIRFRCRSTTQPS